MEMSEEMYKRTCQVCGKLFSQPSSMMIHMRIHTNDRPYSCQLCGRRFVQKVHLTRHLSSKHLHSHPSEKASTTQQSLSSHSFTQPIEQHANREIKTWPVPFSAAISYHEESSQYPVCAKGEVLQCPHCPGTFNGRLSVLEHIYQQHQTILSRPSTESMSFQVEQQSGLVQCQLCNEYVESVALESHMAIHATARGYQCSVCNRHFTTRHSLEAHKRSHNGLKRIYCQWCSRSFVSAKQLRLHTRHHREDRLGLSKCKFCSRRFKKQIHLIRHTASHIRMQMRSNQGSAGGIQKIVPEQEAVVALPVSTEKDCDRDDGFARRNYPGLEVKMEPLVGEAPDASISTAYVEAHPAASCSSTNLLNLSHNSKTIQNGFRSFNNQKSCSSTPETTLAGNVNWSVSKNAMQRHELSSCANCTLVSGELHLMKTEIATLKHFLGNKLTLMEQKMDNLFQMLK